MTDTPSKYTPFEFKTSQKLEIAGEWPQYAIISNEFLRDSLAHSSVEDDDSGPWIEITDNGHIVIRVSNGSAVYKLDREQISTHGLCLVKESE